MKKDFLPYYISRFLLSAIFAIAVFGFTWTALISATILFGFFLLYLHSGWFSVNPEHPFFPLRRDDRGQKIQRKALLLSLLAGLLVYFAVPSLAGIPNHPMLGNLALVLGILTYFAAQWILFARS